MPLAGFLDSPSTPWLTILMADEAFVSPSSRPASVEVMHTGVSGARTLRPPEDAWNSKNRGAWVAGTASRWEDGSGPRCEDREAAGGLGSFEGDAPGASCPPSSPAEEESRGPRVWRGMVDRRRARLGAAPRRESFTPGRHSRRSAWIGGVVWPS
jgi:hypothetical protein